MNDQNFHEIQLSGKQLLFGFMSAVVLLVVIFLLGVSVGRGARTAQPTEPAITATAPGAPGDTTVATGAPPAAPVPGDLNYPAVLKGQTPAPARPEPQPDAAKTPPDVPPAATKSEPTTPPVKPEPAKPEAPKPEPPPAATPTDGWFAQVGAYGTRRAADAIVADLKRKGFDGRVYPFQSMFRVRVGPFATNADAEVTRQRLLKAGVKSTVIR